MKVNEAGRMMTEPMSDIYAMRRANGDWFVLEDQGRLRVPLFHNSRDAMMARLRNFGMLLFKLVALDARLLREIIPGGAGSDVDLYIVNDPFVSLSRGRKTSALLLVAFLALPAVLLFVQLQGYFRGSP